MKLSDIVMAKVERDGRMFDYEVTDLASRWGVEPEAIRALEAAALPAARADRCATNAEAAAVRLAAERLG